MTSQERLQEFAALVRTWAPRLDLVSPEDLDRLEERHLLDSLRAVPLVEASPPGPCVDVGAGAGFPGIPLAIATGRRWLLVEPRKRRAAFLEEAVRRLELDCRVFVGTAEQAARDETLAGRHSLAIARALAVPAEALALLVPLVAPGGTAAVYVGRDARLPPETQEVVAGIASMTVT